MCNWDDAIINRKFTQNNVSHGYFWEEIQRAAVDSSVSWRQQHIVLIMTPFYQDSAPCLCSSTTSFSLSFRIFSLFWIWSTSPLLPCPMFFFTLSRRIYQCRYFFNRKIILAHFCLWSVYILFYSIGCVIFSCASRNIKHIYDEGMDAEYSCLQKE